MKYILALALLALGGCSPFSAKRLDVHLQNTTPMPITVVASCGPFQKSIILYPGQKWKGWVPATPGFSDVHVEIRAYTPQP